MDKLVEEICEAIAPGIFYGFDGCTEAQAQWSWPGHTDKDRALIREIAADALAIAQKRVNELEALVEQMGGGCDANCGGLHSAMQQGREWFCPDCGLMLKRVAYVLPHVKPEVARAALPTMLKGNGDG